MIKIICYAALFSFSIALVSCGGSNDNDGDDNSNADTTGPVITITGDASESVNQDEVYLDPGATASDAVDGDVTTTASGTVDTSTVGSYTLTYIATDSSGNESSATRTVTVLDVSAPVITVSGANPDSVAQNVTYTDPSATASDAVDGTTTIATTGTVDTSTLGSYVLTYTATDAAGNESTATRNVTVTPINLSGTAAAGAAIIGNVTVKGALGNTRSELIEADGSYDIDVSGLTAPYRLRAEGTVGGKSYKLHSYAEASDLGDTVNITPFTDLIIANTAQQIAESFFDSDTTTILDPDEIEAQETALQEKLQNVLSALGLDTAISLLNTSFKADHSGLDAALDIIQIENTSDGIVTITNLLDNSTITDDITDTEDNSDVLIVDPETVIEAVADIQTIANIFVNLSLAFSGGLPAQSTITNLFAEAFLEGDNTKGEFLTDITTDPTLINFNFRSVSVSELDPIQGTATVKFNVVVDDVVETETETWFVSIDQILGWQLLGDQQIVNIQDLSFHCNDYDGLDSETGSCGINVRVWDENFDNNGTGGAPIASATVSIIDGGDGETLKDIIYLGTPDFEAPGDVQVYNEGTGAFEGDYRGFGASVGQIASAIFVTGDIVQYDLYTEELDLTNSASPVVSEGNEVATYTTIIAFPPSLVGLYPVATPVTISAIEGFTLGDSLDVSWVLAEGTVSDEVLLVPSDGNGNRIELWDESFSGSTTTTTFSTSMLDDALLEYTDFDPTTNGYSVLVRIYATDEITEQNHSTDYGTDVNASTGGGGGTDPTLVCGYESGWDDNTDGGLGAPINPNSFADFETVLAACGGGLQLGFADIAGKAFTDFDEMVSFFDTGSGTEVDPGTGEFVDQIDDLAIAFRWYIEDASNHNYLVIYSDTSIDSNLPVGLSYRETMALINVTGTMGQAGSEYSFLKYSEQSNYGDMVRDSGADGEIWSSSDILQ
jgi:hypothetical protein